MISFVAIGTALVMIFLAALLGIWSIGDELRKLQRPRRARTCGTCAFGVVSRKACTVVDPRFICIRYPKGYTVKADWVGCGESEEK